tara:strand:- start:667 stop:933 length:267 start_codon:yes stop_codon:yes gene_type:complete
MFDDGIPPAWAAGFGRIFLADTKEDWEEVYKAWVGRSIKAEYWDRALALSEEDQRQLVRSREVKAVKDYVDKGLADGSLEKLYGGGVD